MGEVMRAALWRRPKWNTAQPSAVRRELKSPERAMVPAATSDAQDVARHARALE